jgi:hypothetical protein
VQKLNNSAKIKRKYIKDIDVQKILEGNE